MLKEMALQEGDENPMISNTSKSLYIQFARLISTLFSPAVIALPTLILVAMASHTANALISTAVAVFFISVGPMLYIGIGVSLGKFTDLDVSVRSQRTGPFLFGIGSCLLGFLVLNLIHAPGSLESIMLLVPTAGIIIMIVTLWWKISMHASTLSACVTLLTLVYGRIVLPAFALMLLMCWSRVVLKRHTVGQVIMGSIAGIGLTWGLISIHGL